jgi:hypothetical protein
MKYCWYSFLLEAESTPGTQCGGKDYVNETKTIGNRPRDLSALCAMPQLTALRRAPFQQNCQRISHSVYKTSLQGFTESAEQNCTWRCTGTPTVHMEWQTERIDCWAS